MNEYLPSLLNVLAAASVFFVSIFTDYRWPMLEATAKFLSIIMVVFGMTLVIWATVYIRGAFLGEVEPRLNVLVKDGPYRFIRHPIYLGMSIALMGIPIGLRNWIGLLGVFLLFLPSEVYRAQLEEKALRRRFGEEWDNYAASTGFFIPF